MKSMTGFGFAEKTTDAWAAAVEIKSYNNRYLEIEMNLPPALSRLEERLRLFLSARACRGRISLFIRLRDFSEKIEVMVNSEAVKAHMKALRGIVQVADISNEIHLAHLLRLEGIIKSYSVSNVEEYWTILEPLLNEALKQLEKARLQEGENTEKTIRALIDDFDEILEKIKRQEPVYKEKIKSFVQNRFREVLGDEVAEDRALEEIAVLLLKSDIHEEVMRLESHLKSVRAILKEKEAAGKKLDFFCQEMNREINTIGAKSYVTEINNGVIQGKEIIERLRELVRNVE